MSTTNYVSVTTDLTDYAPDSTAYLTSSGFAAGAAIEFQVLHVSGAGEDGVFGTLDDVVEDLAGDGHDAWTVVDGSADDLDGMVNGSVMTSWYVNPDDSAGATFLLTAKDSNGIVASNTFTDAAGSINKVYQHWADGDAQPASWNNNILSDAKSNYFEGEVIPHMFAYKASNQTPLVNGATYSFNITYNYYQANSQAGGFAYITTYNTDRDPASLNATTPSEVLLLDSTFTNGADAAHGGMQGSFYTLDANITAVSGPLTSGSGTLDRTVTVTFQYTGATTTSGLAEIYYGLYVATPGQVNNSQFGANAWTGGSLQTTVDIGGSGATSIQLAPSAIIVGSISGYKFGDVNGNGIWDKASGEVGLANWTIFLDANSNGVMDSAERSTTTDTTGFYTFSVTPDANPTTVTNDPYTVREVNQPGWTQTTTNPAGVLISAADPTETNVNFGNQAIIKLLHIEKDASVPGGTANVAGETISYTYVVTNQGNAAIADVMVRDDNATPDNTSDDFNATYVSGDVNNNALLDTSETWTYSSNRTLTQAMIDAGRDLINVATVTGSGAASDTDDANVDVVQTPAFTIAKDVSAVTGGTFDNKADSAGDVIHYTIVLTNTGNQSLTGVTMVDPFATSLSGATESGVVNGLLDVGETWSYTATHTVTQAEINAGVTLLNVATGDTDQTAPQSDDASTVIVQTPSFSIAKDVSSVTGGTVDNKADSAGDVIHYTIVLTNTGNQSLTGVTMVDPFATSLSGATESGIINGILDVGETWSYTATHTVTQAEINAGTTLVNVATGDTDQTAPRSDDASTVIVQTQSNGLIAPTGATIQQYINCTAMSFEDYYASQGGVIQYGVKANKISQTNPGVFFYFSGLSEAIKGVDNVNNATLLAGSDGKADMMKIVVDQSAAGIATFTSSFSNINLYKINDANHNGLIDVGETATKVNLTNSQVAIANGDVTINFTPDAVGSLYVLSVKYSTGSVIGSSVPSKPTFVYDFDTKVNNLLIASEAGSITLAPKTNALTLDGEAGNGAQAVSAPQLSHVFDMAVQYWSEHGASADQLALIKGADVSITDLGGLWLADTTAEGGIRIDDDAAGHGWSLGLGNVAPNKVDLLSALTHEMGHLLGLTHEQMDPDLAVGERVLPMAADTGTDTPPLCVLGTSDELHAVHSG